MDEAAYARRVDPVAFRVGLLDGTGRNAGSTPNSVGGAKRQAAVLQRVAQKAGWVPPCRRTQGSASPAHLARNSHADWVACVWRASRSIAAAVR